MNFARPLAVAAALLLATPALAQPAPAPAPPKPRLIVAISVDQFSADIFAQYRQHFTAGFARLLSGAVFPSGYQGHASTETCPGHSTILTGSRPARTGIIANEWIDPQSTRDNKTVYCAEDPSVPGSTSSNYTVSDRFLKVPTLGERMKALDPATRVVSVAGKDRAAVMMGGHKVDELWWWGGDSFVSYAGRAAPAIVTRINTMAKARLAEAQPAMDLPAICRAHDLAIPVGTGGKTVGTGRFARDAGDTRGFRASPEFDETVLALAAGLIEEMKLGQGNATDIISVGASATDYVGHSYGTEGTETCIQLLTLDQYLGKFLAVLDRTGVDYAVVLTADHGGHDTPERIRIQSAPEATRTSPEFSIKTFDASVAAKLNIPTPVLFAAGLGDVWINPKLSKAQHDAVLAEAIRQYSAHPLVHAVFTRAQIAATPSPHGPPDSWTLLEEARASFDPQRSGDFVIALKPRVTPIPNPGSGYVATHGSFWDYDRRVPILFWRKGMVPFEQPLSVETVDILPTLAALIALPVPAGEIDGRCLDLDAGPGTTCR
jgi:predicted AlkP superfamily pyrophosphatase or phosphodiesterase